MERTRLSAPPSRAHSSKQTFTSISLAYLLSFELQATGLHFAYTSIEHPQAKPLKDKFTAQVSAPTPLEKTSQQLH